MTGLNRTRHGLLGRAVATAVLAVSALATSTARGVEIFGDMLDMGRFYEEQFSGSTSASEVRLAEGLCPPIGCQINLLVHYGFRVFFPEVVRITFRDPVIGPAVCSGVAIAADRILTAGHCACGDSTSYRVAFQKTSQTAPDTYEGLPLTRPPQTYPGYDCFRTWMPQPGRDLALLSVPIATRAEVMVPPPALPMTEPYKSPRAPQLMAAGFGLTEQGKPSVGMLAARIPVRDFFCLSGRVAGSLCSPFREFVLAALPSSVRPEDTCGGDSGGPVYFLAKGGEDKRPEAVHRYLVGITSRGVLGVPQFGAAGCGGGSIYTAIGHVGVLGWLTGNGVPIEVGLKQVNFAEQSIAKPGPVLEFGAPVFE